MGSTCILDCAQACLPTGCAAYEQHMHAHDGLQLRRPPPPGWPRACLPELSLLVKEKAFDDLVHTRMLQWMTVLLTTSSALPRLSLPTPGKPCAQRCQAVQEWGFTCMLDLVAALPTTGPRCARGSIAKIPSALSGRAAHLHAPVGGRAAHKRQRIAQVDPAKALARAGRGVQGHAVVLRAGAGRDALHAHDCPGSSCSRPWLMGDEVHQTWGGALGQQRYLPPPAQRLACKQSMHLIISPGAAWLPALADPADWGRPRQPWHAAMRAAPDMGAHLRVAGRALRDGLEQCRAGLHPQAVRACSGQQARGCRLTSHIHCLALQGPPACCWPRPAAPRWAPSTAARWAAHCGSMHEYAWAVCARFGQQAAGAPLAICMLLAAPSRTALTSAALGAQRRSALGCPLDYHA